MNEALRGVKLLESVSEIGILSFLVELIRFNPRSGELPTDEGIEEIDNPLVLLEVLIFTFDCTLVLLQSVLSPCFISVRDCRFGPRQGETGTVTARFDTFGIPICPAFHLLVVNDRVGRALKRVDTPIEASSLLSFDLDWFTPVVIECLILFPVVFSW